MAENPKTIILRGDPRAAEAPAGGTITPGDQVILNSSSQVIRASSATAVQPKWFATENELLGKDITSDYASGERAYYVVCDADDEVYALLPASATAVVVGSPLKSNGAGKLALASLATDNAIVVAFALEAVDNSAGVTAARVRVRIA